MFQQTLNCRQIDDTLFESITYHGSILLLNYGTLWSPFRYKNQNVAIKVVHRGDTPEEIAKREARFAREVAMLSRVQHKNLVKVDLLLFFIHVMIFRIKVTSLSSIFKIIWYINSLLGLAKSRQW